MGRDGMKRKCVLLQEATPIAWQGTERGDRMKGQAAGASQRHFWCLLGHLYARARVSLGRLEGHFDVPSSASSPQVPPPLPLPLPLTSLPSGKGRIFAIHYALRIQVPESIALVVMKGRGGGEGAITSMAMKKMSRLHQ